MIPEPLKVLLSFLVNTPHHKLCELFDCVELAMGELEFNDLEERVMCENFMTSFWIATKRER